jgi:ribose transport system substrate-binding protein
LPWPLTSTPRPTCSSAARSAGAAQVDQLQAGDVQALVVQKPYDIGYQGVEQAVAAVNGDEVTPEIPTDFVVATADNLEDPEISQYLYKEACD